MALAAAACGGDAPRAGDDAVAGHAADPELSALADSLLPDLERLSRLNALGPIVIERRSTAQVREFVERQIEEELPPSELEGIRRVYSMLGLIPDSLDLRALLLELYAEQIVGYYDPEEKKLFVVEGMTADAVRPVLAHELVHALQDQHVDLDSLIARERGNDRQTAAQAAIEGHATLVMFTMLAEDATGRVMDPATMPNPADQLRPALESPSSDFPVFRSAPRVIRETLLFPYIVGARFVQELWRVQGDSARAAPIGPLLPESTEQVLDPTRFIAARDTPAELRFVEGTGWSIAYENGLGQLETALLFEEHLGEGGGAVARGWDGDRYRLLRSPAGTHALIWYSAWDDAASADRFARQIRHVLNDRLKRDASIEPFTMNRVPFVRVIIPGTPGEEVPPTAVTIQR